MDHRAFAFYLSGRYDAIRLYNPSATLPERERSHPMDFLEGVGGLVVLHHALANDLAPDGDMAASNTFRTSRSWLL